MASHEPTAKTAGGFEYPVHRLSEPLERAQEAKLAAYRELGSRIRGWLRGHGSEHRRRFSLKPEEAKLVHDALAAAQQLPEVSQELQELHDRDLALHRLCREKGSDKGPSAVVRAMGWSTGKRGRSKPAELIVEDYLLLQGLEPYRGLRRLVPHPWPDEGGPSAEPPLSSVDALKAVARAYRFPSDEACWKFLKREKARLKREAEKSGKRAGALVHDFPVPSLLKVLR